MRLRSLALCLALGFGVSRSAHAQDEPAGPTFQPGFVEEQLATGLNPSTMTLAPDGRIFIVEKDGRVFVYRDGRLLDEPFLELEVDDFNERGLGGISFHPDFVNNQLFYVYYTAPRIGRNRISRMRANGDRAVPGTEEVLFELDRLPASIHNGGAMVWLPDTTLLVAVGEGGASELAGDPGSLLGKMLRIRPDGSIPTDNPYYDQLEGDLRAIYSLGFRNSYSMALQPSTGRVFANDVGGYQYEEVNEIFPGRNYGWPLVEGPAGLDNAPPDYQAPLYYYGHDAGCAVLGAAFYEPARLSFPQAYHGMYLFGDYCRGFIRALDPRTGELVGDIGGGLARPVAFVVDSLGDLYYLARPGIGDGSAGDNTGTDDGGLFRVRYVGTGAPVASRSPEDQLVSVGEPARFAGAGSGQPPLRYRWLRDGVPVGGGDSAAVLTLPTTTLADDGARFALVVSNDAGADTSGWATLHVTVNQRPRPVIERPATDATYAAGEAIRFGGGATDPEDGALDSARLTWRVDFHHDEHVHPGITVAGRPGGELIVPRVGEVSANVWYRVTLTAEDTGGLARSTYVDVYPRTVEILLTSEPAGLELNADGLTGSAPFATESVVGLERVATTAAYQNLGDTLYRFLRWTGYPEGERTVAYTVGEGDVTLHAEYARVEPGDGSGLRGRYSAREADGRPGALLYERVDPGVQFDWGVGSPAPGRVPDDGFAVEWTGEVLPLVDGLTYFWVRGDDGFRLTVDDQVIIDSYHDQGATLLNGAVELRAGERVPIRLEYFETGGAALVSLDWDHESFSRQPIPASQLFPDLGFARAGTGEGLELSAANPITLGSTSVWLRDGRGRGTATVELLDALGRVVLREEREVGAAWSNGPLPTGRFAGGAYVLRVRVGDRTRTQQVVVQ